MKAAAREEYKKEDCDKKELQKFVEFWEKKIMKDGWKGGSFNFQTLYNRWLDKAFKGWYGAIRAVIGLFNRAGGR